MGIWGVKGVPSITNTEAYAVILKKKKRRNVGRHELKVETGRRIENMLQ